MRVNEHIAEPVRELTTLCSLVTSLRVREGAAMDLGGSDTGKELITLREKERGTVIFNRVEP